MPTIAMAGNPKAPFLIGLWQLFQADSASYAYAAQARLQGRGASYGRFTADKGQGAEPAAAGPGVAETGVRTKLLTIMK